MYFLIFAVIAQIFNPTAELIIPTGTQTNEANYDVLFLLKDICLFHLCF